MADKPNQTEGEFFAIAKTGRDGVRQMIDTMGDEIWGLAPATISTPRDAYFQRAFVSIVNNEALKDVIATRAGVFSVYKALAKAATMGLQIGGQFPQAHLVPFQGKAELIVSAEGLRFAACTGPGRVLEDAVIRAVYDGEDFRIDFAAATVEHAYDGKADRGKLRGVYGILTRLDGTVQVAYMTRAEIEAVRDGHSGSYKAGRPTPWKSDFDAMALKTAAKRFLKPYAAESEGLAMLLSAEDEAAAEPADPAPMRPISDRLGARLDRAAEALKPTDDNQVEDVQAAPAEEPAAIAEPPAQGPAPVSSSDLF